MVPPNFSTSLTRTCFRLKFAMLEPDTIREREVPKGQTAGNGGTQSSGPRARNGRRRPSHRRTRGPADREPLSGTRGTVGRLKWSRSEPPDDESVPLKLSCSRSSPCSSSSSPSHLARRRQHNKSPMPASLERLLQRSTRILRLSAASCSPRVPTFAPCAH